MGWLNAIQSLIILLMALWILRHSRYHREQSVSKPEPIVRVYVVPGGRMPERKTKGAIGFDTYLRAIVDPFDMEPDGILRKLIFDFESIPDDPDLKKHIAREPREDGKGTELVYWLEPGESVLVGIGFITAMEFPMFYWAAPRSGWAAKYRINLANAPGTIDPDYRGEAGILVVNQGKKRFALRRGMRIAQGIFSEAIIPELQLVSSRDELGDTARGSGGFGSTNEGQKAA